MPSMLKNFFADCVTSNARNNQLNCVSIRRLCAFATACLAFCSPACFGNELDQRLEHELQRLLVGYGRFKGYGVTDAAEIEKTLSPDRRRVLTCNCAGLVHVYSTERRLSSKSSVGGLLG